MKLSIIVPVYNMATDGKLEYCLNSLLAQTISDYEIITVDDASTDESLKILKEFEIRYPDRIHVIASKENLRQGGAKNLGIRFAKGEWIGIVDSDDWVSPKMYEKLLKKAEDTGADVVGCNYSLVYQHTMEVGEIQCNNKNDQLGVLDEEKYRKIILESGSMVVKIYKRNIIVENELWYPEHMFYEDNCMGPLWILYCKHFEKVEEPLYYYYQHATSTVHAISISNCYDRMKAMDLLIEETKKRGFYKRFVPELEYRYTELYFITTLFSCMQGKMKKKYAFVKELKKGMLQTFPLFRDNMYYVQRMGPEEKKLIGILLHSQIAFFLYYYSLNGYRKIRKKWFSH